MDEKIRNERFEKYGSFLFCPKRNVLCFGRDTDEECKHASCLLDDPDYQDLQKRIEENRKKNQQQECEKRAHQDPETDKNEDRTDRGSDQEKR